MRLSYDARVPVPLLIRIFRIAAITEAITWLGLLGSMYEKYIAHSHSAAMQIFGTLHGYAFLAYVLDRVPRARGVQVDAPDDVPRAGGVGAAARYGAVRALGVPALPRALEPLPPGGRSSRRLGEPIRRKYALTGA